MTKLNLEDLEAKAKAVIKYTSQHYTAFVDHEVVPPWEPRRSLAEFNEAANPATVLAMIARIRELEAELAKARNNALEEAAQVASGYVSKDTYDCEYRGIQDWETGEIPCDAERDGGFCRCAVENETGCEIANRIRAMKTQVNND
jgi:hypothetical protein